MLVGAKTMALCALELIENPELVKKAWGEFKEKTKDSPYKCPVPSGKGVSVGQVLLVEFPSISLLFGIAGYCLN